MTLLFWQAWRTSELRSSAVAPPPQPFAPSHSAMPPTPGSAAAYPLGTADVSPVVVEPSQELPSAQAKPAAAKASTRAGAGTSTASATSPNATPSPAPNTTGETGAPAKPPEPEPSSDTVGTSPLIERLIKQRH